MNNRGYVHIFRIIESQLGCLEGNFFLLLKICFSRSREEMETGREEIDPFESIDDPTV